MRALDRYLLVAELLHDRPQDGDLPLLVQLRKALLHEPEQLPAMLGGLSARSHEFEGYRPLVKLIQAVAGQFLVHARSLDLEHAASDQVYSLLLREPADLRAAKPLANRDDISRN